MHVQVLNAAVDRLPGFDSYQVATACSSEEEHGGSAGHYYY